QRHNLRGAADRDARPSRRHAGAGAGRMNATVQTLRAGRAVIADEAHWTKGSLAVDAEGFAVNFRDPKACQWCVTGAMCKVGGPAWLDACTALRDLVSQATLPTWNDLTTTTHADVLALFDRAIAAQEALA